jgi:hypothetical protein
MREPLFTETLQVGIVVRDLDATLRMYVEDYGIGPWDVYEFNPGNAKNLRERPRSLMFRPGTPAHRRAWSRTGCGFDGTGWRYRERHTSSRPASATSLRLDGC